MYEHSYASCENPLCAPCHHYAVGYAQGKNKAKFELRERLRGWVDGTVLRSPRPSKN